MKQLSYVLAIGTGVCGLVIALGSVAPTPLLVGGCFIVLSAAVAVAVAAQK